MAGAHKGSETHACPACPFAEYDTLDRTGTPTETVDVSHVTGEMLDKALEGFRGEIMQVGQQTAPAN